MKTIKTSLFINKQQFIIYGIMSISAVGLVAVINEANRLIFDRFFLGLNPVVLCCLVSILGFLCLSFLRSKSGSDIMRLSNNAAE